jgi:uncharacterized damage-inducible protein DinB
MRIARPSPDEYPAGYEAYVAGLAGDDALPHLAAQTAEVERRLASLPDARALHRYAPGKWSVKQLLGHLVDSDRIFAYRALRFARADETPLSNFDEDLYAQTGAFDARSAADLVGEFRVVRAATVALFAGLPEEALRRKGVARGNAVSVRALAWVTAGHARHHLEVLRERYGV